MWLIDHLLTALWRYIDKNKDNKLSQKEISEFVTMLQNRLKLMKKRV